jgi:hypothetical protein
VTLVKRCVLICDILDVIKNSSLKELIEIFVKKGGKVNKYYLSEVNQRKHTTVFLKEWFSGKNLREAIVRALS